MIFGRVPCDQIIDPKSALWSLQCKCRSCSVRERPSVDGEHIALDLVAQLSLQVTELLLEDSQR